MFETNYVMTFDSFNEYEVIEVPKEVVDNAVEFVQEEEEELPIEEDEDEVDGGDN